MTGRLLLILGLSGLTGCAAAPREAPTSPAQAATTFSTSLSSSAASASHSSENEDGPTIAQWTRRWNALLGRIVQSRTGFVRYRWIHKNPELYKELRSLAEALARPREFRDASQRLAFLINAYNLLVIWNVERHWPMASVRDRRGFFARDRFAVLGERMTLLDLLAKIRKSGEARVHMALVWGAIGSPPLRDEAYAGGWLDQQLDAQAARFVNDPQHNTRLGGLALVSPLFQWFANDFRTRPYGGVRGFLRRYAHPRSPLGRLLREPSRIALTYMQFNWALNIAR